MYGQREIAYAQENIEARKKVFIEIIIFRFVTVFLATIAYYFLFIRGDEYQIYYHDTGYVGMITNLNHSDYSVDICKNIHLATKTFMHDIAKTMMRIDGQYNQDIYGK